MQMLYVCVLCTSCGSPQCCILHDLKFVNAGRGCNKRPYGRGILQSSSPVSAITKRRDMGMYEVPLSVFIGFWDGDYASQRPYVWYYVGVRAFFNMLVRNASPSVPMCFRFLIFSLSGPCELFFFALFSCILGMRSGECDVVSYDHVLCCSVNVSVCFVCCVLDIVW